MSTARTLALILLTLTLTARAADPAPRELFQFRADCKTADAKPAAAYLYVPPNADRIRGVLVGGMATSVEPMLLSSPEIRKACDDESLAMVYIVSHVGALWDRDIDKTPASQPRPNYTGALDTALESLADASGYPELANAPLFFYGHSVSTVFASLAPATYRDRCFGALLHKGGLVLPNEDTEKKILGIPILAVKGQFEEFGPGKEKDEDRTAGYKAMREHILTLHGKYGELAMVSLLVEPGATHFAWTPEHAPFIADFILAAARARIGPDGRMRAVDLARTGRSAGELAAAPPGARRLFHLTPELATAADTVHNALTKKPQFVTFTDPSSGKLVEPAHDLRMTAPLHWIAPDTFTVSATFLESVPRKYPPLPDGEKVTHAPGDVLTRSYGGLAEPVPGKPNTYRVAWTPHRRQEFNLTAYHPGDATYRYAEQCAITKLPKPAGKPQTITFPQPAPVAAKEGATIPLTATSDSNLPVRYTVESGPAIVSDAGNSLVLTALPKRAKLPLTIRVTAWQFGSMVEPKTQSAAPITREIPVNR